MLYNFKIMKEIEIKARLREREKIMEKLGKLGCVFEALITQADTVYAEKIDNLEIFRANKVFLRLRVKNGEKVIFTLKYKDRQATNNLLDSVEHEVEVSSRDEMEKAILLMGFKEMVKISKTRIITHYNGYEICIDEVADLGTFIEMEKLTEDDVAAEGVQEEMFKFFETIGISRADRIMYGYDLLLLEKRLSV